MVRTSISIGEVQNVTYLAAIVLASLVVASPVVSQAQAASGFVTKGHESRCWQARDKEACYRRIEVEAIRGDSQVARHGDTLIIQPSSGARLRLVNNLNQDEGFRRYIFRERNEALRVYLIEVAGYESEGFDLVSMVTGHTNSIANVPLMSSDGTHFVFASSHPGNCEERTEIRIGALDGDSLRTEYVLRHACGEPWGPIRATWASPNVVAFDLEYPRDHTRAAADTTRGQVERLAGGWHLVMMPPWQISIRSAGPVRFGMTVDEANAAAGVQVRDDTSNQCTTWHLASAPDGVLFLAEGHRVVRVDVLGPGVRTRSGVGVGDTEEGVRQAYGDRIVVTPYTAYADSGHYLTFVPRESADTAYRLIFETDGAKVMRYRAGLRPAVEYVEGCSRTVASHLAAQETPQCGLPRPLQCSDSAYITFFRRVAAPLVSGYRLPRVGDFKDYWSYFDSYIYKYEDDRHVAKAPYWTKGDFNNDGITDYAYILIRETDRAKALFAFVSDGNHYTSSLLDQGFDEMGLATQDSGTFKTAAGKGYFPVTPTQPATIHVEKHAIAFFMFESAGSLFAWDARMRKLVRVWTSD
jgi:hypothetical protein